MRWLIRILLLGVLATGLTLLARLNTGYVLLTLPGHRIELSLNFALALIVAGFLAFYLLVRLLATTLGLPVRVARFRAARRREKAHQALVGALREFFAGRYARAEKKVHQAMALGEPADVGLLIAARAAHELRASDRRDRYLAQLAVDSGHPDPARAVNAAQMLLDEQRPEEALATLAVLSKKHTAALRLELRARQRIGQWDRVPALIDQLEKRAVFNTERADVERRHAYRRLIEGKADDATALVEAWKHVPEPYRKETTVAAAAAMAFHALGQCAQAQAIIERSLATEWESDLVNLYGECQGPDVVRQIECAERWLGAHREDPVLLLALGRLCARQQLWGKAQSYLEASISVRPTYSAHLELARLHDRLEQVEQARTHYRASLELAVDQLGRMSGGRRRRSF